MTVERQLEVISGMPGYIQDGWGGDFNSLHGVLGELDERLLGHYNRYLLERHNLKISDPQQKWWAATYIVSEEQMMEAILKTAGKWEG